MNEVREPWLARAILRAFIRGDEGEFILGDLAEDFCSVADSRGVDAARAWYRRQVATTLLHWTFRRRGASLETWAREGRIAIRGLIRAPVYTTATVATLSLGVAGAVAVAALAQAVLQPLPFPEAGQLYAVWETHHDEQRWVAPANYLDWRRSSHTFQGLAAHDTRGASVTVDGRATRETVAAVSGNFFQVLGLPALLGRTFDPRMEPAFPARVAVLSHEAWVGAFGSDRDVIGRTFLVDDLKYDVVGVMKPGLAFPDAGLFAWIRASAEAPGIRGFSGDLTQMRDAWYFQVVGRLADDQTGSAARAEMAAIATRLTESYPDTNADSGIRLVPLLDQTISDFGSTLVLLSLAISLVVLAAGLNVLHLTLARSTARFHDVAIKISMGASGADVRRSMLIEGWLIGVAGAGTGLGLARLLIEVAGGRLGSFVPRSGEIALPPSTVALGLMLGLGVGSIIATAAYARSLAGARGLSLRGATGTTRVGGRTTIAVQVAVVIALLTGSTLLRRSVEELARVDLGFSGENLTTLRVAIPDARARPYDDRIAIYREVVDAVRRLPEVETVAIGSVAPIRMGTRAGVVIVGDPSRRDLPDAGWQPIDVGYFSALGMTMLRGRVFAESDGPDDRDVAVVNETFARTILGGRGALGTQVTMGLTGTDDP